MFDGVEDSGLGEKWSREMEKEKGEDEDRIGIR